MPINARIVAADWSAWWAIFIILFVFPAPGETQGAFWTGW
ncbi:hypothetical protein SAMCFNEI73_Ch2293 [Sinorhizobium americanum]|uniref:Uncharacterized protein n=1 Tax=Sinorhizobium americanum TaxID=194963 RepID=A0A1L3LN99_9HYPH|nr:hypothetical protein SAMCFNEI73_Ch2293 [Sinorhizobium americanum]